MSTTVPTRARPAATRGAGERSGTSSFTGAVALTRLALRRDRVLIPVWLAVFVVTAAGTAASTLDVYPTEESRRGIATTVNTTTAMRALYGPIFDENSAGAVSLFKMNALGAALVALLGIVLVVRHTRAEEESGRLELLGAGVVGRFAALTAALVVAVLTNVALALLTALSLVGTDLPARGSLAFGLSWGLAGIAFSAVAAIAAQLTTVARAATGLSAAVLGATYTLRAVGDTAGEGGPGWASWLSPVGWSQQIRPFAGDRWWVGAISLAFSALAVLCAFVLAGQRDLAAGVLPDRPGNAVAGRSLAGPAGLALRLHRGTLLAWACGFALLGSLLGGIVANIDGAVDSDEARDLINKLGGSGVLVDAYIATVLSFIGILVSAFAVATVLRLASEEALGRAELLLSTRTDRWRWAGSHLAVAVLGSAGLLLIGGLAAGASISSATGDDERLGQVLAAAMIQLPAALVLAGIAIAAVGLVPRLASPISWGALVAFLLLSEVGSLAGLDDRLRDVSPFSHTPLAPAVDITAAPLAGLGAVAVALIALGLVAFRRRDIGRG